MNIIQSPLPGLFILEPKIFNDSRGYFFESFSKRELEQAIGHSIDFVQDNQSRSVRGVVRGLHFQRGEHSQAKLVSCVVGSVLDVAVDLRPGSPTLYKHFSAELSDENHRSLFIPRGFAHGFAVLSEVAVFQYKCDNYYCPEADGGISLLDPSLGIEWPISLESAILSQKDLSLPLLRDIPLPFKPEDL